MMANDLKALIDPEHKGRDLQLLKVFYTACQSEGGTADEIHLRGLKAVLALAQPEPEGPTDEELDALERKFWKLDSVIEYEAGEGFTEVFPKDETFDHRAFARAVLVRHARPTIQPVAVSERWPEFSDCDSFERVWAFNPVLDHWKLTRINQCFHTHWLPHHALPTPTSPTQPPNTP
jgi:hypothetical protein